MQIDDIKYFVTFLNSVFALARSVFDFWSDFINMLKYLIVCTFLSLFYCMLDLVWFFEMNVAFACLLKWCESQHSKSSDYWFLLKWYNATRLHPELLPDLIPQPWFPLFLSLQRSVLLWLKKILKCLLSHMQWDLSFTSFFWS